MKHQNATLGGTFDHLHLGHKAIISRAFEISQNVYLGITTDQYIQTSLSKVDKFAHLIEPYKNREDEVKKYLNDSGFLKRTKIIPIDDRFGTTLIDQSLTGIVVSSETQQVALEINQLRKAKNWPGLEIELVPWVLAKDGLPIHSVRIRQGLVDRKGDVWTLEKDWGVRKMPESVKTQLKKPLGKLIKDQNHDEQSAIYELIVQIKSKNHFIVSVGDAVTASLVSKKYIPQISVIDLNIHRVKVYDSIADIGLRGIKVVKNEKNARSTLSYEVYNSLFELIHHEAKPGVLQIDGEEDLVTLFAILISPLKSLIVYGQPSEGIVVVEVTEEKKLEIKSLIYRFERIFTN